MTFEGMTKREALEAYAEARTTSEALRVQVEMLQVEKLQGELPKCDGGCNYDDGAQETCSRHGRPVAEVWELSQQFARERDAALERVAQVDEAWHSRYRRISAALASIYPGGLTPAGRRVLDLVFAEIDKELENG